MSSCEFDQDCLFSECKFNGTNFYACKFSNTKIKDCTFNNNTFNDVNIDSNCTVQGNDFSDNIQLNNFYLRGQKIEEISQLTNVVETVSEDVETEAAGLDPEIDELPSRANLDDDLKVYRVIFPELMKKYPAIEKDKDSTPQYPGYHTFVGNIEFAFAQDQGGWRVMFFIRNTDDCLGSNLVWVPTTEEINIDTCKEAFENEVKGTAAIAANRSGAEVIKRDLNEFIKLVFNTIKENVEDGKVATESAETTVSLTLVDDIETHSFLNMGYDIVNNVPVIIVGKPFLTSSQQDLNEVRNLLGQYKFAIDGDQVSAGEYTCYVYVPSPFFQQVKARVFKDEILFIK